MPRSTLRLIQSGGMASLQIDELSLWNLNLPPVSRITVSLAGITIRTRWLGGHSIYQITGCEFSVAQELLVLAKGEGNSGI